MNPWILMLIGWAAMAAVMAALWVVQWRRGDAGIVDVAWGMGVGLLATFFAGLTDGAPGRRLLVAVLALLWALRLSGHILRRLLSMPEDGRYQTLKQRWGPKAQRNLFLFFQVQAFWSLLFAIPMLLAMRNGQPFPSLADAIGVLIWLAALAGETVADRQLSRFRSNPANRGKVCREGLWRYSRHPNYFFEWIHWWSYVAFAVGAPDGWLSLLFPPAMLFFLLKVTGIPPTEAQALASRGDAYREYQRTTSKFVPWPPRQTESNT